MFPLPAQAQLVAQGSQPGDVPVRYSNFSLNRLSFSARFVYSLKETYKNK